MPRRSAVPKGMRKVYGRFERWRKQKWPENEPPRNQNPIGFLARGRNDRNCSARASALACLPKTSGGTAFGHEPNSGQADFSLLECSGKSGVWHERQRVFRKRHVFVFSGIKGAGRSQRRSPQWRGTANARHSAGLVVESPVGVLRPVVFIDEIDAIGESRGGVVRLGTNDERELRTDDPAAPGIKQFARLAKSLLGDLTRLVMKNAPGSWIRRGDLALDVSGFRVCCRLAEHNHRQLTSQSPAAPGWRANDKRPDLGSRGIPTGLETPTCTITPSFKT